MSMRKKPSPTLKIVTKSGNITVRQWCRKHTPDLSNEQINRVLWSLGHFYKDHPTRLIDDSAIRLKTEDLRQGYSITSYTKRQAHSKVQPSFNQNNILIGRRVMHKDFSFMGKIMDVKDNIFTIHWENQLTSNFNQEQMKRLNIFAE